MFLNDQEPGCVYNECFDTTCSNHLCQISDKKHRRKHSRAFGRHDDVDVSRLTKFGTDEDEDFRAGVKWMNKDGYNENLGKRRPIHTY